ncbi:BlaI/MecI/CopY family transcriptional regulator [Mariniblastus fucicola]|uniref:BlaI/MecI/CopY family transcriptional regulator n=1 Tax=Mariniblastus fucicola TaxID=980251 RepID=UPI0009FE5871|nr:BlaI/MecI/CopY family transcriptional regulator [Mariniblastus fucicola]
MVDRRPLSKGEMEIARALWAIGPATVREIHEYLSESKPIDFSTVQTYLRRIESKGYASSKLKGRVRTYSSKTKPGTVIRETVDDLVDRLFGGEAMPLVRHLVEDRGIDAEQLAELRELIDRLEKGDKNK